MRWGKEAICLIIMLQYSTHRVKPLKYQKWLIICIFCWRQRKISRSLDRICNYIWKILFSSFEKCCGLFDSQLPSARCHHWEYGKFVNAAKFVRTAILRILKHLWRTVCFCSSHEDNNAKILKRKMKNTC